MPPDPQALATGTGFSAIVIAFLARFGVILVVLVEILTTGLYVAGDTAQIFYQLPQAVVLLIQGVTWFRWSRPTCWPVTASACATSGGGHDRRHLPDQLGGGTTNDHAASVPRE